MNEEQKLTALQCAQICDHEAVAIREIGIDDGSAERAVEACGRRIREAFGVPLDAGLNDYVDVVVNNGSSFQTDERSAELKTWNDAIQKAAVMAKAVPADRTCDERAAAILTLMHPPVSDAALERAAQIAKQMAADDRGPPRINDGYRMWKAACYAIEDEIRALMQPTATGERG